MALTIPGLLIPPHPPPRHSSAFFHFSFPKKVSLGWGICQKPNTAFQILQFSLGRQELSGKTTEWGVKGLQFYTILEVKEQLEL